MKNQASLLVLISVLSLFSCSGDDNENVDSTPVLPEDVKLVTNIHEVFNSYEQDAAITYSNEVMSTYSDDGETYTFNYNEDNKISTAHLQTDNADILFQYESEKLTSIHYEYELYNYNYTFNYSSGNIVSVMKSNSGEGSYDTNDYYTYSSEGLLQTRKLGLNGVIFTFEFDDKVNPFYILWKKYSFFTDLELKLYDIVPVFAKHNPVRIYRNGELYFEASYTYDADNYPQTCYFSRYFDGQQVSGTLAYVY